MEYKVFYHVGDADMTLKSDVHQGTFRIEEDKFLLEGGPGFECGYRDVIRPAQYFRLHFLCRMLEIQTRKGKVFVTTPLIQAAGKPVITNFPRLMKLQKDLDPFVRRAWIEPRTFQRT